MQFSGSSTYRKKNVISTCAPRAFVFILLYAFFFTALLANDRKTAAFPRRISKLLKPATKNPVSLSLLAYAKWHKLQRECLIDPSCKDPPVLIWQCNQNKASKCAGVGDRVRGIQFSLLLAIATKRVFLIDWPAFPYPLDDAFLPATFDWTLPTAVNPSSTVLNWFDCVEPRRCDVGGHMPSVRSLPAPYDNQPDVNLEREDIKARLDKYPELRIWTRMLPESLEFFKSNPYLASLLPAYKLAGLLDLQRMLLASLFTPSDDLKNMMMSFTFDPQVYLGVHARTGADVGEGGDLRFKKVNRNMNETVTEVLKCVTKESVLRRVFISSDSMKFKILFKKRAMRQSIEVFYSPHRALHFGVHPYLTKKLGKEDRYASFLSVFADLLLLGGGKSIIATGSGFAKTAFLFGNATKLVSLNGLKCPK